MMGAAKSIKIMLKVRNTTIREFAKTCDMPTQSLYNKLHRDAMSFDDAERLADLLDFDIVFKDRKTGKEY